MSGSELDLIKQQAAQLQRRMRYLTVALMVALAVAFAAIFFSVQANQNAHPAQLSNPPATQSSGADLPRAESRRLAAAANALLESSSSNSETAALLALRGLQSAYSPEAEAALVTALPR